MNWVETLAEYYRLSRTVKRSIGCVAAGCHKGSAFGLLQELLEPTAPRRR